MIDYGVAVPPGFERVTRMPRMLAHGTLPNGQYEMIGDTEAEAAPVFPGTEAEFAATQGASGPRPSSTVAFYGPEGWLFGRTGWGAARPFADETMYTLRFSRSPLWHGHADGGSVTLYGYGSRLIVDPGKYSYNRSAFRSWFTGRSAHNVVTASGVSFRGPVTRLIAHRASSRLVDTSVTTDADEGATVRRRVLFSRRLGYLVVEDRVTSSVVRRFHQLWHLRERSAPRIEGHRVFTRRERGNVLIVNLAGGRSRIVSGDTDPIQGWVSYHYGKRVAAPVVRVSKAGAAARFLTLLVPGAEVAEASVSDLELTPQGFSFTVTIGDRSEVVSVDGSSASITGAPGRRRARRGR
jgi:hypothetical protein